MFDPSEISRLRQEMAGYAKAFDADVMTAADAVVVLDEAARIKKMAATVESLAAARAADTDVLQRQGDLSPAHGLARRTGTTVSKATDALRTARRLRSQPALDAAARSGDVSVEQASAISEAAAADPAAEARLVERSRLTSLGELREDCERTKAAADRDDEERQRRIHAARFARRRSCADGSGEIVYRSTRDEIAEAWAVVCGFANEAFHRARRAGHHEPSEAYAADGMLAMARAAAGSGPPPGCSRATDDGSTQADRASGPTTDDAPGEPGSGHSTATGAVNTLPGLAPAAAGGGRPVAHQSGPPRPAVPPGRARSPVPTKIVVRVDLTALLRGWVEGDEICDIAGTGPLPVSAVRAMMDAGDPFLAAVVTKGVDVVSVAHLGRRPNAHQRTALDWLAPTCRVAGCDAAARLEYDHRHEWADTHMTLLAWLDRLCDGHHDKKTYDGWALVAGTGKWPMVPPDDPRHPRTSRQDHGARTDVSATPEGLLRPIDGALATTDGVRGSACRSSMSLPGRLSGPVGSKA